MTEQELAVGAEILAYQREQGVGFVVKQGCLGFHSGPLDYAAWLFFKSCVWQCAPEILAALAAESEAK